jgi:threonine dehydrogenase-like Zn-dependent dehydrogenase
LVWETTSWVGPLGDLNLGNCNPRRYVPRLLDLVRTGAINPTSVITQIEDMPTVLDAYETFDRRGSGWTKAVIAP